MRMRRSHHHMMKRQACGFMDSLFRRIKDLSRHHTAVDYDNGQLIRSVIKHNRFCMKFIMDAGNFSVTHVPRKG